MAVPTDILCSRLCLRLVRLLLWLQLARYTSSWLYWLFDSDRVLRLVAQGSSLQCQWTTGHTAHQVLGGTASKLVGRPAPALDIQSAALR